MVRSKPLLPPLMNILDTRLNKNASTSIFGISACFLATISSDFFMEEYYASYVAGIFRTLRLGTGEAHGRAEMMEFNYLLENGALSHAGGKYTIDYARMPAAVGALAKVLLDIEARGDRARAESWFAKYDKMPAELTAALGATKGIPVDIEPKFSFPDEVK